MFRVQSKYPNFYAGHACLPAREEPDRAVPAGLERADRGGPGGGRRDGVRAVRPVALARRDRDREAIQ